MFAAAAKVPVLMQCNAQHATTSSQKEQRQNLLYMLSILYNFLFCVCSLQKRSRNGTRKFGRVTKSIVAFWLLRTDCMMGLTSLWFAGC